MSRTKEFSGIDFDLALGSVHGLRAWRMDKYGRLRALHLDGVAAWRPGVNVAECRKDKDWSAGGIFAPMSFTYLFAGTTAELSDKTEAEAEAEKKPPHNTPVEDCRCGFYAYTDPEHEENRIDGTNRWVLGVVKGTGRTLIGTKGFRCEKAEIVALLDPTRGGLRLHKWRREQRQNLRRVYPDVPLVESRRALLRVAPIEPSVPAPTSDAFWSIP